MGFGYLFLGAIQQRHQDYKFPSLSRKHMFYTSWKKKNMQLWVRKRQRHYGAKGSPHLWPAGKLITSNLKSSKWFGGFMYDPFDQPQISISGV